MQRILIWVPLATIIGLSLALAVLLARPQPNVVVMTIVTPSAPAPIVLPGAFGAWCNWGLVRHTGNDPYPYWCR